MAQATSLDEAKRKRDRNFPLNPNNEEDKESQSGGESDSEGNPNKKPKQTDEEPLSPKRESSPKTQSSITRLRRDLQEMKTQDPSTGSTNLSAITADQESASSRSSLSGDGELIQTQTEDDESSRTNTDNKRKVRDVTPTTEAKEVQNSSPSKRRSWKREDQGKVKDEDEEDEEDQELVGQAKQEINGIGGASKRVVEQDVTMNEAIRNPFLKTSMANDPAWDEPIEDDEPPKSSIATGKAHASLTKSTKPMPTFGSTSKFGSLSESMSPEGSFMSTTGSGFGGFVGFQTVTTQPSAESDANASLASPSAATTKLTTSSFSALASSASPFGALASASSPFSTFASTAGSSFLSQSDTSSEFGKLLQETKEKDKKVGADGENEAEEAEEEGEGEGEEEEEEAGETEAGSKESSGVFGAVRELPAGIEVSTGEEGENNVLQVKGKLFVMDTPTRQWKERGTGNLRLNLSEDRTQVRLVMRADAVLRVILNVLVNSDVVKLQLEDKYVRFGAIENGNAVGFAFKAGQKDGAQQLARAIESALEDANEAKELGRPRESEKDVGKEAREEESA